MTPQLTFLRRSCGSWTSQRRYLFAPAMKPANMTTDFTLTEANNGKFVVDWKGQTEGQMILTLEGDELHRSRDYFGDGAHTSRVEVIDEDCIVLRTAYDGTRFREEIRLVENDQYRLRQTIGFNVKTGELVLCGQYYEARL